LETTIQTLETGYYAIIEDLELTPEPEEFYFQYHDAMASFTEVAGGEIAALQEALAYKREYAGQVLAEFGIKGKKREGGKRQSRQKEAKGEGGDEANNRR
jgi:hypothetical protein